MTRIFLPPQQLASEDITITGDNARHLALVMRIRPGESIYIFDGEGHRYECRVTRVHKKEVIVEKIRKEQYSAESPVSITLAQGMAKGEKMDLIIQKSTELGVSRIIPLITIRSQIRHTEKLDRWRKIALAASQQSARDRIPEIAEPVDYQEFIEQGACIPATDPAKSSITADTEIQKSKEPGACLKRNGNIRGLILSEGLKERNLKKVLTGFKDVTQIILLIGPEGGFVKNEVTAAVEKHFIEVSLGPRILRTETAPITAISIIQYELGDVG